LKKDVGLNFNFISVNNLLKINEQNALVCEDPLGNRARVFVGHSLDRVGMGIGYHVGNGKRVL
jgi:hypothetical protein